MRWLAQYTTADLYKMECIINQKPDCIVSGAQGVCPRRVRACERASYSAAWRLVYVRAVLYVSYGLWCWLTIQYHTMQMLNGLSTIQVAAVQFGAQYCPPFFKMVPKSGFEMCFVPSTFGAGGPNQNTSRIWPRRKKLKPHLMYD